MLAALALTSTGCGAGTAEPALPETPGGSDVAVTAAPTEIIYQVNPRFYGESDCLKAVRADLPRIAGMGCDILWIMPSYEIGQEKSIGSPYCVRDYKKIEPRLGTVGDIRDIVADAHALGMKVILDWVANHTAWDHVWTISNPERYAKDANGNIAATPMWGDVAQLDFSVASTREGMLDAMKFWIDNTGADGFRCDYAEGVPHDFWADAIVSLRADAPDLIMLAESSQTDFFADGFDMVYDWNFAPAMSRLFKGGAPAALLDYVAEQNARVPEKKSLLRYAFNHDVAAENAVDTMFGSEEGTLAAYALAAMSGGIPMIYSSMDCEGLTGKLSFFDYRTLTFSPERAEAFAAINKAYRETADLRGADLRAYASADAVIFSRSAGGHTLLTVINPTDAAISVKTPIALAGEPMTDLLGGSSAPLPTQIELPPYGYVFFKN